MTGGRLLVAAVVLLVAAPAVHAADRVVSTDDGAHGLTANGGVLAWVTADNREHVIGADGKAFDLTLPGVKLHRRDIAPPRLGPATSAGSVFVYERCNPRCAIYEVAAAAGATPQLVDLPATPKGCNDRTPSVSRNLIAFARLDKGTKRTCRRRGLYVFDDTTGRVRRVSGAPAFDTAVTDGMVASIVDIPSTSYNDFGVAVQAFGGRPALLFDDDGPEAGGDHDINSLQFNGGYLYWTSVDTDESGPTTDMVAWRARPRRGAICKREVRSFVSEDYPHPPKPMVAYEFTIGDSSAADGGRVFYAHHPFDTPPPGGVIEATDPAPTFFRTTTGADPVSRAAHVPPGCVWD